MVKQTDKMMVIPRVGNLRQYVGEMSWQGNPIQHASTVVPFWGYIAVLSWSYKDRSATFQAAGELISS